MENGEDEKILTIEEFVAKRRKELYESISSKVARKNCICAKNDKEKLETYKVSEEGKQKIQLALQNDPAYHRYSSKGATSDPKVKAKYTFYVNQKVTEKKYEEQKRRAAEKWAKVEPVLNSTRDYFCANHALLVPYISELMEPFAAKSLKGLGKNYHSISMRYAKATEWQNYDCSINAKTVGIFCEEQDSILKDSLSLRKNGQQWVAPLFKLLLRIDTSEARKTVTRERKQLDQEEKEDFWRLIEREINLKNPEYREFVAFYEEELQKHSWVDAAMQSLEKNPRYGDIVKAYKQNVEIEKIIKQELLEKIPENPINMFPFARTMKRRFILHIGPTNSGKTHDALEALKNAKTGAYLAPLRLLAFEVYELLNVAGVPCSMITGEERNLVEGANHVSSTIELLDQSSLYDVAVIDEAQLIADDIRGGAWTAAILGVRAKEIHVCASPDAEEIILRLIQECGDECVDIVRHERSVPLTYQKEKFSFPRSVKEHDALIVFSKRKVLNCAADLENHGIKCSVIYGDLPYEARQNEVKRFIRGETKVVVSTDAIGMGMNLPIERVVFLETEKYDGKKVRSLKASEIQQIAGRAGRQGLYDEGFYTSEYKNGIQKLYETTLPKIETAALGFTEVLVNVQGKLSTVLETWKNSPNHNLYKKISIDDVLTLCADMEKETEDKKLIYSFITIPFDIKNMELRELWRKAFKHELAGESHLDFSPPQIR